MWSMPRNLRKIAALVIVLMALAGFISGVLGARDVAYLPGEAPVAATTAPAVTAPEVTPLPTDLPPPPVEEPEPEPEAPPPPERPPSPPQDQPPPSAARPPASQDAVGDLIEGADAATTQPPPY